MTRTMTFTKGHGTENDFVLVPDLDGTLDLTEEDVRFLADRRAGIGGDGVIRVVRTEHADESQVRRLAAKAPWFMDYRNADGSRAEMCGNGTRVFAAYLRREGLEDADTFAVATRAGVREIVVEDGPGRTIYATSMGRWRLPHESEARGRGADALVRLAGHDQLPAISVDVGNPHTVVALPTDRELTDLDLHVAPGVTPRPRHGTNVEVVRPLGPGHIAMRVHERGVGETRSCGTGACAAAVATNFWAQEAERTDLWRVDVPGGTVRVRLLPDHGLELAGPAELVADGTVTIPEAARD